MMFIHLRRLHDQPNKQKVTEKGEEVVTQPQITKTKPINSTETRVHPGHQASQLRVDRLRRKLAGAERGSGGGWSFYPFGLWLPQVEMASVWISCSPKKKGTVASQAALVDLKTFESSGEIGGACIQQESLRCQPDQLRFGTRSFFAF